MMTDSRVHRVFWRYGVLARDCPSNGSIVFLVSEEFLALTGTINHRNDLHGGVYDIEGQGTVRAVKPRTLGPSSQTRSHILCRGHRNKLEQLIPHLVDFTRIVEGSSLQLSAEQNGKNQIGQLNVAHILPELSPFLSRL